MEVLVVQVEAEVDLVVEAEVDLEVEPEADLVVETALAEGPYLDFLVELEVDLMEAESVDLLEADLEAAQRVDLVEVGPLQVEGRLQVVWGAMT